MSTGARRYLTDIIWQAGGSGLAQVVAFAALPLITRLYSPGDYALLTLFWQTTMVLVVLVSFRFEYLIQLPAHHDEAEDMYRSLWRLGAAACIGLTGAAIFWGPLVSSASGSASLKPWMFLAPVTALMVSIGIAKQQLVQRKGRFRISGLGELANRVGYVACAVIGYFVLPTPHGLMWAFAIGALVKWGFLHINSSSIGLSQPNHTHARRASWSMSISALKPHWGLAWSTSLANLVSLVFALLVPNVYIASHYGQDALGQFGLVMSTIFLPSVLVAQSTSHVFTQRASRLAAQQLPFIDLWRTTATILAWVGAPVFAMASVLCPWLYPFVFGERWGLAGQIAAAMCLAAGLAFVSTALDRSSLVAKVSWYQPVWHSARAATTMLVLLGAKALDATFEQFIVAFSCQMALLYAIDLAASYAFSKRVPITGDANPPEQLRGRG